MKRVLISIVTSLFIFMNIAACSGEDKIAQHTLEFNVGSRAVGQFDQSVFDNVGKITVSDRQLPVFLRSDEAKEAAKLKMQAAYREMTENGFNMGSIYVENGNGGIRKWGDLGTQEFRGGDHTANLWSRVHGYIVIGSVSPNIQAGCIVNDLLLRWTSGSNMSTWGYPIGNQFKLAGEPNRTYQNFINGYARLNDSTKNATFISDQFLNKDGTTGPSPIAQIGTGQIDGELPLWALGNTAAIAASIKRAEEKIKTTSIIKEGGYDLGSANEYANLWQPENFVISQRFAGGDNTGNPYNWGTQGRLMISDYDAEAFPLLDDNLTRWAQLSSFRQVGYPLSYPYKSGDLTYQIFSKSYFKTDKLGYIEHVKLYAGAFSESDKAAIPAEDGLAAAGSNFMAVYKNINNTGANFGLPEGFISYDSKLKIFMQSFIPPEGGTNYMIQKGASGACFTVTGKAAELLKDKGISATGAPVGAEFEAGGKKYQNFEKGYINISDSKFVKSKKFLNVQNAEAALNTIEIHADTGVLSDNAGFNAQDVKEKFTGAVKSLHAGGNELYTPASKVIIDNGSAYQEFINTSSSAKGRMIIIMPSKNAKPFVVKDQVYTEFLYQGGIFGAISSPIEEQFCFGSRVYQNFLSGYVSVDFNNVTAYVSGQQISKSGVITDNITGEEINSVHGDVGKFGDITRIPMALRDKLVEVQAAFQAEYKRLIDSGFYPGESDSELVHQWAPQSSYAWVNQTFRQGDSSATVFNTPAAMKIFLMDLDKGAFSVHGEMMTAWLENDGFSKLGYPVGNQVFYDGDLYQNFNGGYLVCINGLSSSTKIVANEQFTIPQAEKESKWKNAYLAFLAIPVAAAAAVAVIVILKKKKQNTAEVISNNENENQ